MFGINDNNQDTTNQAVAPKPEDTSAALPPSPFMNDSPPAAAPPDPAAATASAPALPAEPALTPITDSSAPVPPPLQNEDQLVSLKEQALNSLAPLVNHLDQTPEEKFKTTMMLIQASDNSSLVKEAYEAANQITDEKARAQALLDVVNEINYFTQKESGKDKA